MRTQPGREHGRRTVVGQSAQRSSSVDQSSAGRTRIMNVGRGQDGWGGRVGVNCVECSPACTHAMIECKCAGANGDVCVTQHIHNNE